MKKIIFAICILALTACSNPKIHKNIYGITLSKEYSSVKKIQKAVIRDINKKGLIHEFTPFKFWVQYFVNGCNNLIEYRESSCGRFGSMEFIYGIDMYFEDLKLDWDSVVFRYYRKDPNTVIVYEICSYADAVAYEELRTFLTEKYGEPSSPHSYGCMWEHKGYKCVLTDTHLKYLDNNTLLELKSEFL